MKKKKIISIIICLILVIGIISYILFNNRVTSTITLDINPSIEIILTKNNKVKNVIALNDDAKKIIDFKINGKLLDNVLNSIVDNLIKNNYMNEDHTVDLILYSNGKISNKELEEKLHKSFEEKELFPNIITIEKISKEDEAFAKKYNMSPAKAAYINSISKDRKNIKVDDLSNKSVRELMFTKENGKYCDEGYFLEGDHCFKEIGRVRAQSGEVCPQRSYQYSGKCYEEVEPDISDELYCNEPRTLENGRCTITEVIDAEPINFTCSGKKTTRRELGFEEGNLDEVICVDLSSATHPVSPCETHDGTEYTFSGGKCYWHRAPVIAEGCPGKIQVGDMCWDDASSILICEGDRDGRRYGSRNDYCEHSIRYIDLVVSEYRCPDDFTLNGNKCSRTEVEDAIHKLQCPNGYSLVDNDRCINLNKEMSKENGLVCSGDDTTKLKGNQCITYEIIEAKDY